MNHFPGPHCIGAEAAAFLGSDDWVAQRYRLLRDRCGEHRANNWFKAFSAHSDGLRTWIKEVSEAPRSS